MTDCTNDTAALLAAQIKLVAESRQTASRALETKRKLLADWEAQNKDLLDALESASRLVTDTETNLRELTLRVFAETGSKSPADGVGIREMTKYEYDAQVAFKWAKQHDIALKLDEAVFKKIAKASPPDFVKVTIEPQATIATDLSKYLL